MISKETRIKLARLVSESKLPGSQFIANKIRPEEATQEIKTVAAGIVEQQRRGEEIIKEVSAKDQNISNWLQQETIEKFVGSHANVTACMDTMSQMMSTDKIVLYFKDFVCNGKAFGATVTFFNRLPWFWIEKGFLKEGTLEPTEGTDEHSNEAAAQIMVKALATELAKCYPLSVSFETFAKRLHEVIFVEEEKE